MTIQFPDDEIRNHDDRTGKYITTSWEAPSIRMTTSCREMHKNLKSQEDLDELATAQDSEAKARASLATAGSTLRDARENQHQVRQSRGLNPQQQWRCTVIGPAQGRNGSASSAVVHSGPHGVQKCKGTPAKRKEKQPHTKRTSNLQCQ